MRYILAPLLIFLSFAYTPIEANVEATFGCLDYITGNIGDDIQTLSVLPFLPEDPFFVNRELLATADPHTLVHTVLNGWLMHTRKEKNPFIEKLPAKPWPPSSALNPLLISIHFTPTFEPYLSTQESIQYLRAHGPVGCRDLYTQRTLQKLGVPCYFSGCLTLTLERTHTERGNIIYAVDLDHASLKALQKRTSTPIQTLTHIVPHNILYNRTARFELARSLLQKYQSAKCVVTSRLHATMPCLAFNTPVLLIKNTDVRFNGLKELVHHCTPRTFKKSPKIYDFDNPPENPQDYLPLRDTLIETVTSWVQSQH